MIEKYSDSIYRYHNLPYPASTLATVDLQTALLYGGDGHTQEEWLAIKDPHGFVVPDAELLYQVMRINHALKDDSSEQGDAAREVTQALRKHFDDSFLMTTTKAVYAEKYGKVIHQCPLAQRQAPRSIQIPFYHPLVLAPQRDEKELNVTRSQPQAAQDLLCELLGAGWDAAPTIFQDVASRYQGQLRETRLWTLYQEERKNHPERVVCLGVGNNDGFDLNAVGSIGGRWPALGVRLAQSPGGTP
jgi:hypothetical protein